MQSPDLFEGKVKSLCYIGGKSVRQWRGSEKGSGRWMWSPRAKAACWRSPAPPAKDPH